VAETVVWVDPAGSATTLTDGTDGINLEWGRSGVDMAPIGHVADEIPLQPGGRLREIRTRPRDIDLPLWVQADTAADLRTKVRALLRAFDPLRGDGVLRVTTDTGDTRQISARYVDGLMGDEASSRAAVGWRRLVLTVRAYDPYWEDPSQVVHVITPSTTIESIPYTVETLVTTVDEPVRGFFSNPFLPFARLNTTTTVLTSTTLYKSGSFFPFFPLTLLNSSLFASVTAQNDGDVDAWPIWTIEGPGSSILLRNQTTGKVLSLPSVTLTAGQQVQIDTRPNRRSVTVLGVNGFSSLSSDSNLWPLVSGANGISIEMGGTGADSRVTLRFTERYLGL
jgi:hypothetical protein